MRLDQPPVALSRVFASKRSILRDNRAWLDLLMRLISGCTMWLINGEKKRIKVLEHVMYWRKKSVLFEGC